MIARRQKRSAGGFTLVELLVVMGIIAIMLALGLPAWRSVIASANKAKCSSNLRQIGTSMQAFAGDHNGLLPISGDTVTYGSRDGTTGEYGWTQQLEPYLSTDKSIFTCPDSSKVYTQNNPYSYFNGAHAAYAANGGTFEAVNINKIRNLSALIISGDISTGGFGQTDADKDDYTTDCAFGGKTGKAIPIHLGSVNLVFADGHVENVTAFDPNTMTTIYSGPDPTKTNYLQ